MILPTFQAQSPTINGYYLGWSSCTSYAFAMAAHFDRQRFVMTGEQLRRKTGDTVGGTTLAQNDYAARTGWGVDLDTVYRYPWTEFARRINAGQGAVLQGWYAPIADSRFDAGRGFRGNHAIAVMPGWIGMDPLADGRASGVYKYHAEAYPQSLLRNFAGRLNIGTDYTRLGDGLVYASFTRDNVTTVSYKAVVHPTPPDTSIRFGVYTVVNGVVTGGSFANTGGFSATCTPPRLYSWPGHTSQSLVRLTSGARTGQYLRSTWAKEV